MTATEARRLGDIGDDEWSWRVDAGDDSDVVVTDQHVATVFAFEAWGAHCLNQL